MLLKRGEDTRHQMACRLLTRRPVTSGWISSHPIAHPRVRDLIEADGDYFIMNFFERLYLMHRDGDIEVERWKMRESWISYSLTASPLFQQVWDESCGLHHADFVAYVEANSDDGTCGGAGDQTTAPGGTPATAPDR